MAADFSPRQLGAGPSRSGWRVGRLFGIPVFVAPNLVALGLVLALIYASVVQHGLLHANVAESYAVSMGFIALLVGSVLAHELGHAMTARQLGVPVSSVTLWLLGGYTEMRCHPVRPQAELAISLAGPGVSLGLGLSGAVAAGMFGPHNIGGEFAGQLGASNMLIVAFNLLPGLPLDGGSVVRALVWRFSGDRHRGTIAAGLMGQLLAIIILGVGLAVGTESDQVLALVLLIATVTFSAVLWLMASHVVRSARMSRGATMLSVRDVAQDPLWVLPELSVAEALARARDAHAPAIMVGDGAQQPIGLVIERAARAIPERRRTSVAIVHAARSVDLIPSLNSDLSGGQLLEAIQQQPVDEFVVSSPDGVTRVVLASHVSAVLRMRRPAR